MHTTASFPQRTVVPEEYEVTYPDGRRQTFTSESEAYYAIRLTGGGVKRVQVQP